MNWLKQIPFQEMSTDRLVLRAMVEDDKHEIFKLRSNEQVNMFIDRPTNIKVADAVVFINQVIRGIRDGKWLYWAISFKTNSSLIGTICLWNFKEDNEVAELGFELFPEYQGKGLMSEAVVCIVTYAFEILKVKRIEAFSHEDNISSRKLLERSGFQQDPAKKDENNPNYIAHYLTAQTLIKKL